MASVIASTMDEFSKHSIERNSKIILTLIREEKLLIRPIYNHKIKPAGIQAAYDGLRDQPDEFMGSLLTGTDFDNSIN